MTIRNEVLVKVIFSQACVSHSVHGVRGSSYDVTSCLGAWSHVPSGKGGLCLVPCSFWGVSVQGSLCQGDPPKERPHQECWAVRILLECFLVDFMCTAFSCSLLCFQVHKISSYTNERTRPEKSYWHCYPQPTEKLSTVF